MSLAPTRNFPLAEFSNEDDSREEDQWVKPELRFYGRWCQSMEDICCSSFRTVASGLGFDRSGGGPGGVRAHLEVGSDSDLGSGGRSQA